MTDTKTTAAKDDDPGVFLSVLIGGLGVALLVVIIVGIFTIARNWEDTNIVFNHKQGTLTVESSTWWGLVERSTEYKYSSLKGWHWIDPQGQEQWLKDVDQPKANFKDAANGQSLETKTNVLQSQMPVDQSN